MRESLENLGRFDPIRARERLLSSFNAANTQVIYVDEAIVAFFVVQEHIDHLHLDHLYVHPDHQGKRIGSHIITKIIEQARCRGKGIRLGALKNSRSNSFYLSHGFRKTHEDKFDIYYELTE